MKKIFLVILNLATLFSYSTAHANDVEIVDVVVKKTSENTFIFSVTLKHEDTGWDHYANEWQVISPTGEVLATRILAHPHVDEQPFTRSLSDVYVPRTVGEVSIRAKDSVHGWAAETLATDVPQ